MYKGLTIGAPARKSDPQKVSFSGHTDTGTAAYVESGLKCPAKIWENLCCIPAVL